MKKLLVLRLFIFFLFPTIQLLCMDQKSLPTELLKNFYSSRKQKIFLIPKTLLFEPLSTYNFVNWKVLKVKCFQ